MIAPPSSAWVDLLVSLLVVAGSLLALIGSIGLLRLRSFFQRIHAPTLGATLGTWCVVGATIAYFSLHEGRLLLHAVLVALFVALTAPITTIMLMRAALFRQRQAGEAAPESRNG